MRYSLAYNSCIDKLYTVVYNSVGPASTDSRTEYQTCQLCFTMDCRNNCGQSRSYEEVTNHATSQFELGITARSTNCGCVSHWDRSEESRHRLLYEGGCSSIGCQLLLAPSFPSYKFAPVGLGTIGQ